MATFYLINQVILGTQVYLPGSLIDDAVDPATAIQSAGGRLVASSVSGVATAAAECAALKARGGAGDVQAMEGIMNVAADLADVSAAISTVSLGGTGGAALIGTSDASTVQSKFDAFSLSTAAALIGTVGGSTVQLKITSFSALRTSLKASAAAASVGYVPQSASAVSAYNGTVLSIADALDELAKRIKAGSL